MRLLVVFLFATVICGPTAAMDFENRSALFGLSYVLGTPKKITAKTPVLLLLHGCKLDGERIIELTEIADYAEKRGIIVVAPSQTVFQNFDRCWNFFMARNQTRDMAGSELSQLLRITQSVQEEFGLRQDNAYVMGFSAGGAQAMNLFACYPEVFKGAAIHSGVPYAAAQGLAEAQSVIENGPRTSRKVLQRRFQECAAGVSKRLRKIAILHGSQDQRVVPSNSRALLGQVHTGPLSVMSKSSVCSTKLGVPAKEYRSKYLHTLYLEVSPLAHKWSGSRANSSYAEPEGPAATKLFLDHLGL